jgi:hypothetical protein
MISATSSPWPTMTRLSTSEWGKLQNIQSFLSEFFAELIQLPTNWRCPPAIVEAANRLVAYNVQRTSAKDPLIAGKTKLKLPAAEHMQLREFPAEDDEAAGIAQEIADLGNSCWGEVGVLGRNRALWSACGRHCSNVRCRRSSHRDATNSFPPNSGGWWLRLRKSSGRSTGATSPSS